RRHRSLPRRRGARGCAPSPVRDAGIPRRYRATARRRAGRRDDLDRADSARTRARREQPLGLSATKTARTATGTLRRKIDCHETRSTRNPPTTGPIASAAALTPAHVPIALPRSLGGNAFVMIESVAGIMNAA